jgi:hypothetical protein
MRVITRPCSSLLILHASWHTSCIYSAFQAARMPPDGPVALAYAFTLQMMYIASFSAVFTAISVCCAASGYCSRFDKCPQHTSSLSGEQWVQELLHGHDDRIFNELGMRKELFRHLVEVLKRDAGVQDTRYVTAEEQLAVFLHFARRGLSNRALQERFQRSGDTISKCTFFYLTGNPRCC